MICATGMIADNHINFFFISLLTPPLLVQEIRSPLDILVLQAIEKPT